MPDFRRKYVLFLVAFLQSHKNCFQGRYPKQKIFKEGADRIELSKDLSLFKNHLSVYIVYIQYSDLLKSSHMCDTFSECRPLFKIDCFRNFNKKSFRKYSGCLWSPYHDLRELWELNSRTITNYYVISIMYTNHLLHKQLNSHMCGITATIN